MNYKEINNNNKDGLYIYFKYRLTHQLFMVYFAGAVISNLFYYIIRGFTETSLKASFDDEIVLFETESIDIYALNWRLYFESVAMEMRSSKDNFELSYVENDNPLTAYYDVHLVSESDSSYDQSVTDFSLFCNPENDPICTEDSIKAVYYMESMREILVEARNIESYFVIFESSGTTISNLDLSNMAKYNSIHECSEVSREDINECIQDESQCTSDALECKNKMDCNEIYAGDVSSHDEVYIDFRCTEFYQQSIDQNQIKFLPVLNFEESIFAQHLFSCTSHKISNNDGSFVFCLAVDLLKLDEYISINEEKDALLLLNVGNSLIKVNFTDEVVQFTNSGKNSGLLAEQLAELTEPYSECVREKRSEVTGAVEDQISNFLDSKSSTFTESISIDECQLQLAIKKIEIDTSTDLGDLPSLTYEFTIMTIQDLTLLDETVNQVGFISKSLIFYKLYTEVFLNQVLFLIISLLVKNFSLEFTKPLKALSRTLERLINQKLDQDTYVEELDDIPMKFQEMLNLRRQVKDFGLLFILNQKLKTQNEDFEFYEEIIEIFERKGNPDGLYVVYDHMINLYTKNKNYEEALRYSKIIRYLIEVWRDKIKDEEIYNRDAIITMNTKLFYNYYRLLNVMKKNLLIQGNYDRKDWTDASKSLQKIFAFLNDIEIKETVVLKLMLKRVNLHFHLGKINHAEKGLAKAMSRFNDYMKHGKFSVHLTPDQKMLYYIQQKMYLTSGQIYIRKGRKKKAYEMLIQCLELGEIYSPSIRCKCLDIMGDLLSDINSELFHREIRYSYNLSYFYSRNPKDFVFLIDSTSELNTNLMKIWEVIKPIFNVKMRPEDTFSIYRFHSEIVEVYQRKPKCDIERQDFDKMLDDLKQNANAKERVTIESMSKMIDLINDYPDSCCKILISFVFGDETSRSTHKKGTMTNKFQLAATSITKSNTAYDQLVEKIEESFLQIVMVSQCKNEEHVNKLKRASTSAKHSMFINLIKKEDISEYTNEIIEFFD